MFIFQLISDSSFADTICPSSPSRQTPVTKEIRVLVNKVTILVISSAQSYPWNWYCAIMRSLALTVLLGLFGLSKQLDHEEALSELEWTLAQLPHHREKRFLFMTDEKRIVMPPGSQLVLTPTLALPFLRSVCLKSFVCTGIVKHLEITPIFV